MNRPRLPWGWQTTLDRSLETGLKPVSFLYKTACRLEDQEHKIVYRVKFLSLHRFLLNKKNCLAYKTVQLTVNTAYKVFGENQTIPIC